MQSPIKQRYYEKTKHLRETPEFRLLIKRRGFKHRFGKTLEEFESMIDLQCGRCLVCGDEFVRAQWNAFEPVLDHDHSCCVGERSCGKCIRGVIHRKCNSGLGFLKDDPGVLRAAASYIEGYKCQQRS